MEEGRIAAAGPAADICRGIPEGAGRIAAGYPADLVCLDSYRDFPAYLDRQLVRMTVKRGALVMNTETRG